MPETKIGDEVRIARLAEEPHGLSGLTGHRAVVVGVRLGGRILEVCMDPPWRDASGGVIDVLMLPSRYVEPLDP